MNSSCSLSKLITLRFSGGPGSVIVRKKISDHDIVIYIIMIVCVNACILCEQHSESHLSIFYAMTFLTSVCILMCANKCRHSYITVTVNGCVLPSSPDITTFPLLKGPVPLMFTAATFTEYSLCGTSSFSGTT